MDRALGFTQKLIAFTFDDAFDMFILLKIIFEVLDRETLALTYFNLFFYIIGK